MSHPETVDDYRLMIETRRPFTQANYGDGEWYCILGYRGQNCNGGKYTPDLSIALQQTLTQPRFSFWGFNPGQKLLDEVRQWIGDNDIRCQWINKEILANANCRGELGGFIKAIHNRRTLVVGPEHLRRAQPIIKNNGFIQIPNQNAFRTIDQIADQVTEAINKAGADLVLFSCGMATKPLIWRLIGTIPETTTLLDCGAIWDPYAGVLSRSGYRKPKYRQSLALNLQTAGLQDLILSVLADNESVWHQTKESR